MARWAKPDFTIIYKLSWNQLSEHFLTTAESWWIFLYKILFGLLYLIWSIGQWCYRGWRPQGSEKNRKSKLFAPTSSSDLKILYNWIIKLHSSKYRNIFSQPTTNESKGKKWFRFFLIICEFSPIVKIIKKNLFFYSSWITRKFCSRYEIYEEIECNEKYPLNPEISLSRNAFSQLEPHKLARPDLQHNLFSQGISVRSHKYK